MQSLQLLSQRETLRARARYVSVPRAQSAQALNVPRPLVEHYSVSKGSSQEYANRYCDICPYDRNQVSVGHRYLNASWLLERHGGKWWIATQAPIPTTFHAFLSLLINPVAPPGINHPGTYVRTVVQLTQYSEGGATKAHPYFPSVVGQSILIEPEPGSNVPPLYATLDEAEFLAEGCCLKSRVTISAPDRNPVTFFHLLYGAWPDHGVPSPKDRQTLLAFLKLAEDTNRSSDPDDPPMVVGCSAGVGRTGTFVALASLLRARKVLAPAQKPTSYTAVPQSVLGPLQISDEIAEEIDFLREQRPCMVQRNEQVILIYEMLDQGLTRR